MEPENPFHYGSPAESESFTDRERELSAVVSRMMNGQNVILLSPRRYGKTSLLLGAVEQVRKRRGRSGYASLLRCSSHREVAEALTTAVLNGPLSWLTSQRQKLTDVFGHLRVSPAIEMNPDGSLQASLRPLTPERVNWRDMIANSMRLLLQAESGNHPVSLVLDEFQQVAEVDPHLPNVFKTIADELRHVSLVFAGSKMHVMQRIAVGPGAPLMGMGEHISLGPVPEDAMVPFLLKRARVGGKQLTTAAARRIFALVEGIPNDVQRLAYEAFELAEQTIDEALVDSAMERVVSHRALDYEEKFTQLAPTQQRVLTALARYPGMPVFGREFVAEVDVANHSTVRKALAVLEDDELVARRSGEWVVADTFFRSWLRQASP